MLIYDDKNLPNNHSYFNGHLFHRVIKSFMVQTGDPLGKRVLNMPRNKDLTQVNLFRDRYYFYFQVMQNWYDR